MKRINLCIAYPNKGNYSETFIYNHINRLSPHLSIYEGFYPAKDTDENPILPFPLSFLLVRGMLRNLLPRFYHNIYSKSIANFFRKASIDLLLAEYGPMGASLADACMQAGIPFIVHFHGFDAYHYDTLTKYSSAYQRMFQQASAIIAVSQDMKKQLISLGADPNKIYYNPYGVSVEKFSGAVPENSPPVFIYVGRFTEKKAPYNTIKAFQKVRSEYPSARLVMIGGGELFERCRKMVKDLDLNESVELRGVQGHDQIAEALKHARAFVQHSMRAKNGDSEGTPNTILEAAAAGLPIISTYHAGIKDAVVHTETGLLSEEGDIDGMAIHMTKLARDPELAGRMGRASRSFIEKNFSMDKRIGTLEKIIIEQMEKHSPALKQDYR